MFHYDVTTKQVTDPPANLAGTAGHMSWNSVSKLIIEHWLHDSENLVALDISKSGVTFSVTKK